MFQTKVVLKIKKHILCSVAFIFLFFLENRFVYEITWKNMIQPGRPKMTIWRMRIACRITKATNTYSGYVTPIYSERQKKKKKVSPTHVHCPSCYWSLTLWTTIPSNILFTIQPTVTDSWLWKFSSSEWHSLAWNMWNNTAWRATQLTKWQQINERTSLLQTMDSVQHNKAVSQPLWHTFTHCTDTLVGRQSCLPWQCVPELFTTSKAAAALQWPPTPSRTEFKSK